MEKNMNIFAFFAEHVRRRRYELLLSIVYARDKISYVLSWWKNIIRIVKKPLVFLHEKNFYEFISISVYLSCQLLLKIILCIIIDHVARCWKITYSNIQMNYRRI